MIPQTLINEIKRQSRWLTIDIVVEMLEQHNRDKESADEATGQLSTPKEKEITQIVENMKF